MLELCGKPLNCFAEAHRLQTEVSVDSYSQQYSILSQVSAKPIYEVKHSDGSQPHNSLRRTQLSVSCDQFCHVRMPRVFQMLQINNTKFLTTNTWITDGPGGGGEGSSSNILVWPAPSIWQKSMTLTFLRKKTLQVATVQTQTHKIPVPHTLSFKADFCMYQSINQSIKN